MGLFGGCSSSAWFCLVMGTDYFECVSTVRNYFLVNRRPCGFLTPTRGLRKSDPLSPYLFLLCAEVFSALLDHKVRLGLLQDVQVCPATPSIHHLLFTDDSLLFGVASVEECGHIKSVLFDYERALSQLCVV